MTNSNPFLLDRSRLQTYYDCGRKFYWQYLHEGIGVTPTRSAIPLVIGGATHKGLEELLQGHSEETAVAAAKAEFHHKLGAGLQLEPTEDALEVYREQELLVEGLVRVFALVGLPALLEDYEILEVEQEDLLDLTPKLVFMGRADGLLRRKSNGGLYVLSFKTANRYDSKRAGDAMVDVQGLSESIIVGKRRKEQVVGVQMVYLIKGAREEWPKDSGKWQQSSPILHPWRRDSDGALAHSWKWGDATGNHTLGKGWRKCNVYDLMAMHDWIELLAQRKVQPEAGSGLAGIVVMPEPILRRESEIDDWLEQTTGTGQRIAVYAEMARSTTPFRKALNLWFPQNRRSCEWPSKCPCWDICFGPCGAEPLESGLYQKREPHHELEKATLGVDKSSDPC